MSQRLPYLSTYMGHVTPQLMDRIVQTSDTALMSYLAITQRISYIDSRFRHRQDYPSAADLVRGAPTECDAHRHGFFYADMSLQLPGIDLTEGDF